MRLKRKKGANVLCRQYSFDSGKAEYFSAVVSGKGYLEVRLDSPDGKCVAAIEFDLDGPSGVFAALSEALSGAHDVYFVFSNRNIGFYNWHFL